MTKQDEAALAIPLDSVDAAGDDEFATGDQVAVFFTRAEIQALAKEARPKNGISSAAELALQQKAWRRILKAESVDRNAQAKETGK